MGSQKDSPAICASSGAPQTPASSAFSKVASSRLKPRLFGSSLSAAARARPAATQAVARHSVGF